MAFDLIDEGKDILCRAGRISLELYKIMIPIIIVVKLLQEFGIISWLAMPLVPVMKLVGLPGEMGLVWGTAMLNNIYSSMIVFVALPEHAHLSVAQVSVLCTMVLVAHGLPVELQIVRKSGPTLWFQGALRILSALVLGWMLSKLYAWGGWLQEMNQVLWQPKPETGLLTDWVLGQVQNLCMIFVIITCLTAIMRIFTQLRITDLCVRLLWPVLRTLGIGREAGPLTIVGMVMGLAYGGGMIMEEARSGKVAARDIFYSLSLMGLSHSIFEDTMLMAVLGGHFSALLWGRVCFTLVVVAMLVKLVEWRGDAFFLRYLFKPVESYIAPEPCCPGAVMPPQ